VSRLRIMYMVPLVRIVAARPKIKVRISGRVTINL